MGLNIERQILFNGVPSLSIRLELILSFVSLLLLFCLVRVEVFLQELINLLRAQVNLKLFNVISFQRDISSIEDVAQVVNYFHEIFSQEIMLLDEYSSLLPSFELLLVIAQTEE